MSYFSDTIIMTINYSHDFATALLIVSATTLWMLSLMYPLSEDAALELYFIRIYKGITGIVKSSLYWILLAGVPRIIYYRQYEWSDMTGDLQIIATIIKHIVMFTLVGAGLFYWSRLASKVRGLKLKHNL
jgi:hypothetical protein